jgi:hypothetical protein
MMMKTRWVTVSMIAVLMAALAPLTAQAAVPIQASRSALIDAEIASVRLMENGSVRVEATYHCDERYGYAPPRITLHLEPHWYDEWVGDGVICDGTVKTFVRRLKPLEGQQIGERFVLYINVSVAESPSDPYPGGLHAGGGDLYSVEPDGSLSRLIDVRIQRMQVNDRGRLVVGMSYECPTGYPVGVDDPDWADVVMYQFTSQDEWVIYDTLAHDVVCDGTRHTLVRRFRTTGMDPTQPVLVSVEIGIGEDAQASWPH